MPLSEENTQFNQKSEPDSVHTSPPDSVETLEDGDHDGVVALLDENTANRIAAGEVIERPSSVVKELVENSIDAQATRVEVELIEGGKRRVVVRDNGTGMSRNDAILALQRHATSKIRTSDDLFTIRTLGFRGEALPSIASVSDMTLLTKRAQDETATEITISGGDILSVEPAAGMEGTTFTIENLFFNTPARLKFLKTTQTELNHAIELMQRMALAYPRIAFRLVHNGHEMFAYPGASDPLHAIAAVWGTAAAREMVPIRYDSPSLRVRGYVSKPSLTKASRSAQAVFVNGRPVRSRTITHAFDNALKHLMTTDRFPVAALFIGIAPELVDVNVHPTKIEVRFTRDGEIYQAVHQAVSDALLAGGLMPEVSVVASTPSSGREITPPRAALSSFGQSAIDLPHFGLDSHAAHTGNSFAPITGNQQTALAFSKPEVSEVATYPVDEFAENNPRSDSESPAPKAVERVEEIPVNGYIGFDGQRIGSLRVIGQSRNTYIVAETEDALLLIDQHIAHERVLYEQMMNGAADVASRWGVVAQHLALPQTVEFDERSARVVFERLDALARAGFVLDEFGRNTFVVRAVPAALSGKDYLATLHEIVEEIATRSVERRLLVPHESAVIMASCKMAVKKGDPLTIDEMTRLLSDLARMRNPFTCPHGRPILLVLSHHEMDRKFHRI